MTALIQDALHSLGITRNYRGFEYAMTAILLVLENARCLESVVSAIYFQVASAYGRSWVSIERNIRTIIQRAWAINPERLIQMAGYPLDGPPTVSEFIDIVATYVLRSCKPNS